jgi:hypothetical protein
MEGIATATLTNGTRYMASHYSCDPEKDAAWVLRNNRGGAREWNREMELFEDVYDGEPVHSDYSKKLHWQAGPIEPKRGGIYISGTDCGQTLEPAHVLLEIAFNPVSVTALLEVLPVVAGESMKTFGPAILDALASRIPGQWQSVDHCADATVTTRSGTNGESAQDEAKKVGLNLRQSTNVWEVRKSAVTWLLTERNENDEPIFKIDAANCPRLAQALAGAYKYEERGDATGPGREIKKPLKNGWSHVADAFQYAAIEVRNRLSGAKQTTSHKRRGSWA